MEIKYILNKDIDKQKWNDCINKSFNGLIYSTTDFLDTMATNWDALVMDNYEVVMPLIFRKKIGIYYIYPPAFSQQIGITSINKISNDLIDFFVKSIPKKFKYIEMNLNTTNEFNSEKVIKRNNFTLLLNNNFDFLQNNFSRSAHRNIKKAIAENIVIKEDISFVEIIKLHRQRFNDAVGANSKDYHNLQLLFTILIKKKLLFTIGAFKDDKLIAGSIYFVYKNRITFIINGNNEMSLKNGASHLLMQQTIHKYCNSNYILDFEGSDFLEFARFYKQYGAEVENYYMLKINNLLFPISLFKK